MSPSSHFLPSFIPTSIPAMDSIIDNKAKKNTSDVQSKTKILTPPSVTDFVVGNSQSDPTNTVPHQYTADRDPTASDDFLDGWREGSRWNNETNGKLWICSESTKVHTLWKLVESSSLFPEMLEDPLPVVAIGNNLYKVFLPHGLMITSILRVYIKDHCTIASGFNFDTTDLTLTLNMEFYPYLNFDGKEAYITCVRRSYK